MKIKAKAKSRKAETLSESVVTMAVFGILLLGLTDFMSAQINYVARLHHRDELINKAQILVAKNNILGNLGNADIISDDYVWSKDTKVLTLKYDATKKQTDEIQFALP